MLDLGELKAGSSLLSTNKALAEIFKATNGLSLHELVGPVAEIAESAVQEWMSPVVGIPLPSALTLAEANKVGATYQSTLSSIQALSKSVLDAQDASFSYARNLVEDQWKVVERLQADHFHAYEKLVEDLQRQITSLLQPSIDQGVFNAAHRALLPPNLRNLAGRITPDEVVCFVEGGSIPICEVPSEEIAIKIIAAETVKDQRALLNRYSRRILDDCETAIRVVVAPRIEKLRPFVDEALEVARQGHEKAAQALFTTILDSLVSFRFEGDERKVIKNRKAEDEIPEVIDRMTLRESLVWLPVWNAHAAYWPDRNDPVPYQYSRHASVHHVSKRQYNQRNCIQSAMLVCSVFASQAQK
ncbi:MULTISPECIES: hypothetical protein [unclassified Corynebacterium]|uniref:hypothetical protein n=1 Tax=unclassified Corynebacterium TaxID=2624378 RepID=UPI0011786EF1|nr:MULTISPECIES: hypothetical protein [unclassified Corynebacterium]TVX75841.1 hypothetical protein FPP74_11990 [Corynebacterium sp. NML180780]